MRKKTAIIANRGPISRLRIRYARGLLFLSIVTQAVSALREPFTWKIVHPAKLPGDGGSGRCYLRSNRNILSNCSAGGHRFLHRRTDPDTGREEFLAVLAIWRNMPRRRHSVLLFSVVNRNKEVGNPERSVFTEYFFLDKRVTIALKVDPAVIPAYIAISCRSGCCHLNVSLK